VTSGAEREGDVVRALLSRFFFTGSTPERLGATRILLGLGLIPFHILQFHNLLQVELQGPRYFYLDPIWYFDLLGIEYHYPYVVLGAFALLLFVTGAFSVGWRTRPAAVLMLLLILYLQGARDSIAGDVHHRYVIPFHVLLFFALSRCGEVLSLDARRSGKPANLAEWEASWPIQASQVYVASFYLWSGLAKLRMSGLAWIHGGERIQSLLLARATRFGLGEGGEPSGSALALWLAQFPTLLEAVAVGTLAFELGFPAVLVVRRAAVRLAFLAGMTFFHVANFILINVKFLFLPVVFVLFFDCSSFLRVLTRRAAEYAKARGTRLR
jgi:hypothetical protein